MARSTAKRPEHRPDLPPTFGKRNGGCGRLVETACAGPGCGDLVVAPERVARAWCGWCTLGFAARGQRGQPLRRPHD